LATYKKSLDLKVRYSFSYFKIQIHIILDKARVRVSYPEIRETKRSQIKQSGIIRVESEKQRMGLERLKKTRQKFRK